MRRPASIHPRTSPRIHVPYVVIVSMVPKVSPIPERYHSIIHPVKRHLTAPRANAYFATPHRARANAYLTPGELAGGMRSTSKPGTRERISPRDFRLRQAGRCRRPLPLT